MTFAGAGGCQSNPENYLTDTKTQLRGEEKTAQQSFKQEVGD